MVFRVKEDRVFAQRGDVGTEARDDDHERGVLDEDGGIAMIGMVVVGPVRDHDVGLPLADLAGDRSPILEGGQQLAVVDVEHFRGDAEDLRALLDLGRAAAGEHRSRDLVVPNVAVRDAHELHRVTELGPTRCRPAGVELAIVGMSAEDDDP